MNPEPSTWGLRDQPPPLWYDYLDGALMLTSPVEWLGRLSSINLDAENMYGISTLRVALSKTFRPEFWRLGATHSATLFVEDQRLAVPTFYGNYPVWHQLWGGRPVGNGFIDVTYPYGDQTDVAGLHYSIVSEQGETHFDLLGEASVWGSDASFARTEAVFTTSVPLMKRTNLYIRATTGAATSGTPYQREFFLSRADNYEEQMDGFFRAVSSINYRTSADASMFLQGGAGVRGYNAGNSGESLFGNEMAGLNFDLDIPNPLAGIWGIGALTPGVFGDAGWIQSYTARADAGIRLGLNLLSLLPYQLRGVAEEYDKIPIVYLDLPLYESLPLDGKPNFAFRWAISLGAAF